MAAMSPLAVVAVVAAGILVWVVAVGFWVHLDRKRSMKRGRTTGTEGRFAGSQSVVVMVPPEMELHVAEDAMKRIGGHEIREVGRTIVGWAGSTWTNVPSRGEYQLIISPTRQSDGSTCYCCSSRPRNPLAWVGPGMSQELARRMASAIASVPHGPNTPFSAGS
jgi:hypothetical protein